MRRPYAPDSGKNGHGEDSMTSCDGLTGRRITCIVCFALIAAVVVLFATTGALRAQEDAGSDAAGVSAVARPVEAAADGLRIGMAKIEITPDPDRVTVHLAGYSGRHRKPADAVLDPVYARALVIADEDGNLFGVVGLDLCSMHGEFRDRVLELAAPHGFTDQNLMLAATHTHSSLHLGRSFILRLLFGSVDDALFERTAQIVTDALAAAKQAMRPARWEAATRMVSGLNRSRLDPAFEVDGHQMADGAAPDRGKYPVNERLTVLRFTGNEGIPVGAVAHFTAHPTILSPKNLALSADFPGVVCDRLEKNLGQGSVVLFLNGTLGDTAPIPDWTDDVTEEIRQMRAYGNEVADRAEEVLAAAEPMSDSSVSAGVAKREFNQVTLRPLWGWTLSRSMSRAFVTQPEVTFQAIRLGDVVLIAVPGEPTTRVGDDLRSLCPEGKSCTIVGQSNAAIGYIVTAQEYEGGTYAADTCFFGPKVIDEVRAGAGEALSALG